MLDTIPASHAGEFHAPAEAPSIVRHRPEFSGRAGEYFGIWIVNLLLSIVTLGIYSAWAKVRTERYFYANTTLAGSSFEYLADPIAILKGRLIAYAVVIALLLSSRFSPGLYLLLIFGVFVVLPVLIVLSLRFRARNSAWRGLTFRFTESGGAAYGPFMGWPMLSGMSLSLLYPIMRKRQHQFVVDGHRFGNQPFEFHGKTEAYYGPYGVAAGIFVVLFVAMMFGMGALFDKATADASAGGKVMATLALFYLGFFLVMIFLRVRYGNLMWNSSHLGPHRFESSQRVRDMIWIYASNLVAIVCTIGMATPWAMVRLARYRAEHFAVLASGSIEDFVAEAGDRHGATGAELVDALDLGADFGF